MLSRGEGVAPSQIAAGYPKGEEALGRRLNRQLQPSETESQQSSRALSALKADQPTYLLKMSSL
ncbi:MAG: hypothetical protein NTV80_27030 [Verrucomicrobia bacterium]|nr:hypothetical protein [Verrucomicrobiota bacterium]